MAEIRIINSSINATTEVDINFNGTLEGVANASLPVNVNLTDGLGDVIPTSVALTGNDLDIVIPTYIAPDGVLFKTNEPTQYTSYRTGDVGWRIQNAWFDYTPPVRPKAIAELDFLSTSFFNVLKNPLVVNGISSTIRFVDVDGGQTFSVTANKNLVVIDKLTGLMYTRLSGSSAATWNANIDNALSYSIIVNGVTYDDWFLACKEEYENVYHQYTGINPSVDTSTGTQVLSNYLNMSSSSTSPTNTLNFYYYELAVRYLQPISKLVGLNAVYVRNARTLVTAP